MIIMRKMGRELKLVTRILKEVVISLAMNGLKELVALVMEILNLSMRGAKSTTDKLDNKAQTQLAICVWLFEICKNLSEP